MITKQQYVEFLVGTVANFTATHLADHLDSVSHDAITDFLQRERLTARCLWELVATLIADSPHAFATESFGVLLSCLGLVESASKARAKNALPNQDRFIARVSANGIAESARPRISTGLSENPKYVLYL